MFVADVKCSQATWQTVPNSLIGSAKASVSEAVVRTWPTHMLWEEDRKDRRLPSETRWTSSARYVGIWPHNANAWRTRQASLNSTRRRTESQCNVVTTSGSGDEACCGILQRQDSPHDVLGHSIVHTEAKFSTLADGKIWTPEPGAFAAF